MEEKEALRQLPEIQNIAEYLRGMEFRKKLFGGVDAESVLEHFSAVTLQYEAIISAFMQQADIHARQLAETQAILRCKEEAAALPGQPAQSQQWCGAAAAYPQAQQMQHQQVQQPMPHQQAQQPMPHQQIQQPMPHQQAQQPMPHQQVQQPMPPQQAQQNPWGYTPWAQPAPQGYAPQAFPPQSPAYAWQNGAGSLPEQAYQYA